MPRPAPRRRIPQPTAQDFAMAAPMGGLNTVDAGGDMPADDCVLLYNMIAGEFGLRTRLGYAEWCTGLTGAADNTVRSVLPFAGSKANGSTDKLFAATSDGLWDVSASSNAPPQPVVYPTQTGDAGYATACVFNVPGGDRYLVVCDEVNGLYVYAESTTTWTKIAQGAGAGQISGVDPATFVHVTVYNNRIWFTQKDTTLGWYLGLNSIFGAATSFDFGAKFRAGGDLRGLFNWTVDGGGGLQTRLVAISGGGDVVIYGGIDPASANTFSVQGAWYVGGVPAGRRIATDYGGDLLVLSSLGVMPMSKLVLGDPIVDRTQFSTFKIANLFNTLMNTYRTIKGWSIRIHPSDNALLITVPTADGQPTYQLAMSLARRSWSQYGGPSTTCAGLPMVSADAWGGKLYFGTADGRLCVNQNYIDNVLLANPNSYSPVAFELITSFQDMKTAKKKRVTMVRPKFVSQGGAVNWTTETRYDYDLHEVAPPVGAGVPGAGQWDGGVWDVDKWGGDYTPQQAASGAYGMGTAVAVAIRGTAVSRTSLVGIDLMYEIGSFL